jgi:uncharacterized Zn finger protein (UPF0148 family)
MLTVSQCETVAFTHNGEIICPECARKVAGSAIAFAAAEEGYHNGTDLSPLIRYSLDEYISENASELADEKYDYSEDPEKWQEAFDSYPDFVPCDSCGRELS